MKKSRFTDSQIIDALKRAEAGLTAPEICWELNIRASIVNRFTELGMPQTGAMA